MRKALAAAALAAGLAACGSQAAAHTVTITSAEVLAKRIGCTHWHATIPPGLYTQTEGGCALHGRQAALATFGDTTGESAWVQAETSLGGFLVQGGGWAVNAPTSGDAEAIATKLGGHTS